VLSCNPKPLAVSVMEFALVRFPRSSPSGRGADSAAVSSSSHDGAPRARADGDPMGADRPPQPAGCPVRSQGRLIVIGMAAAHQTYLDQPGYLVVLSTSHRSAWFSSAAAASPPGRPSTQTPSASLASRHIGAACLAAEPLGDRARNTTFPRGARFQGS
jgi:hypothetical protein